jgi:hypothetical protein
MTGLSTTANLEACQGLFLAEMTLLRKYASIEAPEGSRPHEWELPEKSELDKLALGKAVKLAFWKRHGSTLSQTSRRDGYSNLCHAGTLFQYGYQRFDLETTRDLFPLAYGLNPQEVGFLSTGFFCSSGIAAIASFFEAFDLVDDHTLEMPADPYFETSLLHTEMKGKTAGLGPKNSPFRWIYLDSISKSNPLDMLPERVGEEERKLCVAVDTTCWRRSSTHMRKLLAWARVNTVPIVLLRSHLKLDFLGLDNGRLGSLFALFPIGIDRDRMKHVKDICNQAKARVVRTGRNFRIEDIPPFWGDETAYSLLDRRLQRIESSVEILYGEFFKLMPKQQIMMPHHRLFLLLALDGPSRERAQAMAERLRNHHFDAVQTSGFGFDFFAIDAYFDDSCRKEVVRLAPGVYSLKSPLDAARSTSCL